MIDLKHEVEQPLYSIYQYNDKLFKIVRFKGFRNFINHFSESHQSNDVKLENSLSRSRKVILELSLCNQWEWFFTGTFNPQLWDRNNISLLKSKLIQWLSDRSKAYESKLSFILIPEQHKDGSWHFHGLLSGIPLSKLSHFDPKIHPLDLCRNDIWNWNEFQSKFGFCSLSYVKNPLSCGFYVTKYITKEMNQLKSEVGFHLYSCSRNLNRSFLFSYEYVNNNRLNEYLSDHYEYCDTGFMVVDRESDDLDWLSEAQPLDNINFHDFDNQFDDILENVVESFDQMYICGIV